MLKNLFLVSVFSLLLAGCSGQTSTNPKPQNTPKVVVASFYPLAFIADRVAGDAVQVVNLAGNSEVHSYEPTPKDMVALGQADLVLLQGAGLEPWADSVATELRSQNTPVLKLAESFDLVEIDENHQDEDDHEDEHDHHHHHNHGSFDPHIWLDPTMAAEMVDRITSAMVEMDGENKAVFERNAKDLKSEFAQLDEFFKSNLQNCERREVIISHDAFGYLARRYNFETHSIAGLSPHDEPSAKTLAALKNKAEKGQTHLLVEENSVKKFSETLAAETRLEMLPINPLESGSLEGEKDFFAISRQNAQSLKTALGCP